MVGALTGAIEKVTYMNQMIDKNQKTLKYNLRSANDKAESFSFTCLYWKKNMQFLQDYEKKVQKIRDATSGLQLQDKYNNLFKTVFKKTGLEEYSEKP